MASSSYTPSTWAVAQLTDLGIPVTRGGVKALVGWQQAEGGFNHKNPLNTTQGAAGASTFNSVGVKTYPDWRTAIKATSQTLRNGRYDGILAGLRSGDAGAVASAIGQSPWGTAGPLVRQTIGAAPSSVPNVTPSSSTVAPAPVTTTAPGVDNSQLRRSMIANFLQQGGVKSTSATGALASGWQAAQDVPGTTTAVSPTQAAPTGTASTAKVRADAIDEDKLPYQWGGGHAGKVKDVYNSAPLDCSGAVSAVLGINPRVAKEFKAWGKAGDGGLKGVTVYAKDTHVLLKIDGHFFGTSRTNPGGGAGWIKQEDISPEYLRGFTARHA